MAARTALAARFSPLQHFPGTHFSTQPCRMRNGAQPMRQVSDASGGFMREQPRSLSTIRLNDVFLPRLHRNRTAVPFGENRCVPVRNVGFLNFY
ncbi:hypothetical protein [Geobacter anodireducens]